MKNKKSIYILLPVVLFIWGAVAYRFFKFIPPEPVAENDSKPMLSTRKKITEAKNKISIDVDYRDPFLGKAYSTPNNKPVKSKRLIKKQAVVYEEPHAIILYKGMVSDNKNKKKVFMVNINGHNYLMNEKQTEEKVTIITGSRTQVIIRYRGKSEMLKLEP